MGCDTPSLFSLPETGATRPQPQDATAPQDAGISTPAGSPDSTTDATAAQVVAGEPSPLVPPAVKRIKAPFKIMVDSREKLPWTFLDIRSDARDQNAIIDVETERFGLPNGDYMILGFPQMVIERKSKADLFSSIGQRRDNFEQRLCRMQEELKWAAVVVEAEMEEIITAPPDYSHMNVKALVRTIDSWMIRYPRVHWLFYRGARRAEVRAFRLFERWWKHHKDEIDLTAL